MKTRKTKYTISFKGPKLHIDENRNEKVNLKP